MQRSNQINKCMMRVDRVTKRLLLRVQPGEIIMIYHDDLDEMAAEMIIDKQVGAVLNAGQMMTGRYPALGAKHLLQAGIPLYEIPQFEFDQLSDNEVILEKRVLTVVGKHPIVCHPFTWRDWQSRYRQAMSNHNKCFEQFINNTLHYALQEYQQYIACAQWPKLKHSLQDRDVVIVVRGSGYLRDLAAMHAYITIEKPILIAVDGGADALLEMGHIPHLIVGDMDSASDAALGSGAELIVHAYADGNCPGMQRIESLGLPARAVSAPGTSEDMAMNLAFDQGARWIVAVGTHTHMLDFLEKGRRGMSSTLLTRMRIGSRLIDAKGFGILLNRSNQQHRSRFERANLEQMHPMLREGSSDESLNYHTGLE